VFRECGVSCDLVVLRVEQDDGSGQRDCLIGDEEGSVLGAVVVEHQPIGEPQLDSTDVCGGLLDPASGEETIRPPSAA
jgi:hypothetical protein